MLTAFGFTEDAFERPLREFSGGQRAKAALAHLLIDDPDYLILDEPTNHLDIQTVRWLEEFISAGKHASIIVSHDRYFLDRVATKIWEMDRGELHLYAPAARAYTSFLLQKEARLEKERREYEAFVMQRDKLRATVAGLRATHTSSDYSQVRSREKQLARTESQLLAPAPVQPARSINVRLESARRGGNAFVLEAAGVSKAYALPLFSDLQLNVQQGERLGIAGPNGAGKSTLLRILAGDLPPDGGTIRYNPASQHAYYAQNSHDQLDLSKTAVQAVMDGAPAGEEQARSLLGRMRISGDDADKAAAAFSGGERRRIMLSLLMARKADVLLLDEPTNDLDIASREALESVLGDYTGAILVVSHDRYLLDRICERVLWIENGLWGIVDGGYEAYEAAHRPAAPRATEEKREKGSKRTPFKRRSQIETQIARCEREIAKGDARRAQIDALFADPDVYSDVPRLRELHAELEALKKKNAELFGEWERYAGELEALEI